MNILALYRRIVPEKVREYGNVKVQELRCNYLNWHNMERRSFGKLNSDKIFYVMRVGEREGMQGWGLAAACSIVLNNIKYATDHGWIPIVDLTNAIIPAIQDDGMVGSVNTWECYFEQLCDYSLEEVYQSRHVFFSPGNQPKGAVDWKGADDLLKPEYDIYCKLAEKYIRIKPEIRIQAERAWMDLKKRVGDAKILGVGIRAGFLRNQLTHICPNHPKSFQVGEYINMIRHYMRKYGGDYLFLSCDDRYYWENVTKEFGERCLYIDRALGHYFDEDGNVIPKEDDRGAVEKNTISMVNDQISYIIELYCLSKCDSLFCDKGGGSILALLWNNRRYEHYHCEYRGSYV